MPYEFVRITHAFSDVSGLIRAWSTRCERMAIFEHVGTVTEKRHIHCALFGTDCSKKQLRNIGASLLGAVALKGNQVCSFKEWKTVGTAEEEKPLIYMTKGEYDPVFLKTYTPEDAKRWKEAWVSRPEAQSRSEQLFELFLKEAPPKIYIETEHNRALAMAMTPDEGLKALRNIHFEAVRKISSAFAMQHSKNIWTQATAALHRMLVLTYCMRHDIPIHPDWKKYAA